MQHVSMLDQPCPAQSERLESAVLDVSARRSPPETAYLFGMRSTQRQRTNPQLKPLINAAEAEIRAMIRDALVWSMMNAPACTSSWFSAAIHLPCIEVTQSEIRGAKWC